MANIKGQMKRNLQNEKRRLANSSFKSGLKSAVKNVEVSVENNDKEAAVLDFKKKNLIVETDKLKEELKTPVKELTPNEGESLWDKEK